MNKYTKAALGILACTLTAAAVQAQGTIIVKGTESAMKKGTESAIKNGTKSAMEKAIGNTVKNGVAATRSDLGVRSRKNSGFIPANASINASGIKVNRSQVKETAERIKLLKAAVEKKQAEAAAKQQQAKNLHQDLMDGVTANKSELLKGYHLTRDYIAGYYARRIEPYADRLDYTPDKDSDTVLFRGMLVTPDELVKLLKEGFSPKYSTWNTGTRDGLSAVSLSSSVVEASNYIFQSGFKKDGIGILFTVRRNPAMELGTDLSVNPTKTIYYSYEDIPAEDIVDVSIWGEYGLESLSKVLQKAKEGKISSNHWVNQFGSKMFF